MTFLPWVSAQIKGAKYHLQRDNHEPNNRNRVGVHDTPPGEWPQECRRPSKVAVVLFYLSVVSTMLGTIISVRTLFYVHVR